MALLFVGNRRNPRPNISVMIASAMALGAMIGYHASDKNQGIVATGANFIGHIDKDVVALPGLDSIPVYDVVPGYYPRPEYIGGYVAAELWDEFTCEGAGYLLQAGTNHVANNTATGTLLTIDAGVLRLAVEGDIATHEVMTASAGIVDSANVRMLVKRLESQVRIPAAA
jgi:hypothetical protein